MTWNDIFKIAVIIIASAGGIGGVIVAGVRFTSDIIAKNLVNKYQLKLNEKLELYRNKLDRKNYVSKTKFNAEFQIYRDLSSAFFDLVVVVSNLIPDGYIMIPKGEKDADELENELYTETTKCLERAQDVLNKNAPFIPKGFFDAYDAILHECRIQRNVIREKFNCSNLSPDKGKPEIEDYKRTGEINQKLHELNDMIREHLASLEVTE